MIRSGLVLGSLLLVTTACGTQAGPPRGGGSLEPGHTRQSGSATQTATGGPAISGTGQHGPPPYRLRYEAHELVLRPFGWCYNTACIDGIPDENPPSVGSQAEILVYVPFEDWDLVATFRRVGARGRGTQTVKPTQDDAGWYVLRPVGPPGRYDVDLFSQGEGDMAARFRWETRTDEGAADS